MKQLKLLPILCTSVFWAMPAFAQTAQDQILSELKGLGFSEITISRTFLGRTRFFAEGEGRSREIILNPNTGEILRDYWRFEEEEEVDERDDDDEDIEDEDFEDEEDEGDLGDDDHDDEEEEDGDEDEDDEEDDDDEDDDEDGDD